MRESGEFQQEKDPTNEDDSRDAVPCDVVLMLLLPRLSGPEHDEEHCQAAQKDGDGGGQEAAAGPSGIAATRITCLHQAKVLLAAEPLGAQLD